MYTHTNTHNYIGQSSCRHLIGILSQVIGGLLNKRIIHSCVGGLKGINGDCSSMLGLATAESCYQPRLEGEKGEGVCFFLTLPVKADHKEPWPLIERCN